MSDKFFPEVKADADNQFNLLKPLKPCAQDSVSGKYIVADDLYRTSEYSLKGKLAIEAYKQIVTCCKNVVTNVYSLCFYLKSFFENHTYVQTFSLSTGWKPKECCCLSDLEFFELLEKVGISKSTFYRYKDVGEYVDITKGCLRSELSGYSFSLVCEMISVARLFFNAYHYSRFDELGVLSLTDIIPATTTIDEINKYKKIMALRLKYKQPFEFSSSSDSLYQKIKTDTPLPDVLKIWSEWEQQQANKQLEDTMSGKSDSSEPTSEVDETINSLREEIQKLRLGYVPELGMCEGCKYKGVNLNKCRSCRRYKDMKDLYEGV